MPIIIYGGAKKTVTKQLKCRHDWHGPCMDDIARFNKCLECYCIEYDLPTEQAYFKAVEESNKARNDRDD